MASKLFFITGSSGIGKTTIVPFLRNLLSSEYDIHDFDEKLTEEVGRDIDLLDNWRINTTKHWINVAEENLKINKLTIIVGLIYPDEIKQLDPQILYSVCLLDASDEIISQRLMGKRFSNSEKIAKLKQGSNLTPEEFIQENKKLMEKLRNETLDLDGQIIDTTNDTSRQTTEKIVSWVLKVI